MSRHNIFRRAEQLRLSIGDLIAGTNKQRATAYSRGAGSGSTDRQVVDVVVTPNEVTPRHGTGVLVHRAFSNSPGILSIRSHNLYGEHLLGEAAVHLSHSDFSRAEAFGNVVAELEGYTPRRVVCIPYYADDMLTALAIKYHYGVPLCTYVMDDNNIFSRDIPDDLVKELLDHSDLRLAISTELRDAYESKFGTKFWLVPPLVEPALIQTSPSTPDPLLWESRRGILIGNIWIRKWFDLLRQTLRGSGLRVDWYGNSSQWTDISDEELAADGIDKRGFIAESELAGICRRYPFALVPTGTLSANEDRHGQAIAKLSLPTRLPFILAATNTPIVVLGNANSAAARFVKRFEIGAVADYDTHEYVSAVEAVVTPAAQTAFRNNAVTRAGEFSSAEIDGWIWKSLEAGRACDDRFEDLMPRLPSDLIRYIESPAPKSVSGDFALIYEVMRRLKKYGLQPDFVLDIGASSGVWSHTVRQVFPRSRFILLDPLSSRYFAEGGSEYRRVNPTFEFVEAAASNKEGETVFQISPDLYGSSLLKPADFRSYEEIKVRVTTVDQIAKDKKITGRGILKVDVQCAEHLVLEGSSKLLTSVDVVVLELSLVRYAPTAKIFPEMLAQMDSLGFRFFDEAGGWRSPVDGTLLQKDVIFVRHELFPTEISN